MPDPNNARFYPDTSLQPIVVFDPKTGEQNIKIYPFNNANPLHGTATPENVTGYLMRNTQWLVQSIGVDGFRLDAAKNIEGFTLDYYDRSVYRSSFRTLLNGQQQQIFCFSEVFDGDQNYLQTFVRKDINPSDPGRIGGNRDTLDFPLYFALHDNLTGNGFANDWNNIRGASLDLHDDGLHNGSQGVTFVQSHDSEGPYLSNVAYAYTLMMPGNTIVYYNGKEFGNNRDFPKDGRGDALGGLYGNAITNLVDLRNRYGRGDYIERFVEKENFAFERKGSALVMLSNRLDGGYDSRTIQTSFPGGTLLLELTGNAGNSFADPFHDIPQVLRVNGDGTVNVRFLRNAQPGFNQFTGDGYLVYGLPTPQGASSLTNVAQVMKGGTPTAGTNGTHAPRRRERHQGQLLPGEARHGGGQSPRQLGQPRRLRRRRQRPAEDRRRAGRQQQRPGRLRHPRQHCLRVRGIQRHPQPRVGLRPQPRRRRHRAGRRALRADDRHDQAE